MENQSIKINSNNSSTTAQSTASQNLQHNHSISGQQPQSSSGSIIDEAATVDTQQHQQQQSGGPGRSTSTLSHHQQYTPCQQRWQSEIMTPGSSSTGPIPGMVLSSPHFPQPSQQQYGHQQHHLGVPSPSPYGYGGQQPPQQHSPNSNRPYPPPPPQMLHPAMMYPLPHGYGPPVGPQGTSIYGHPSSQQYWTSRSVNGPIGGGQQQQQPGIIGQSGTQAATHYPSQSQQSGQSATNETPSTSRHTPQFSSQQQQQIPVPSPSGATNSSHDEALEENAAHRPRSSQSLHQQQHQFATPQGQPQQPPPQQIPLQLPLHPHFQQQQQIRYSSAAMLPPHGAPPQLPAGQLQPSPIVGGPHPGSSMQPQMHHMSMAQIQMHPHHPAGSFSAGHPGMYFTPPHPNHSVAAINQQAPPISILSGLKPAQREAVEKLIGQLANPKQQMSSEMVYERRLFYERLVLLNEQQGEVLSGPPQVSKSMVDLHALYKAVKQKGGFEKTIRDKIWKNLCTDANIDMQQSSAAGFQLRKHYQKYLLKLECLEQNLNAQDLIEFAEKQKKKKKEKEAPSITASSSTVTSLAAAGPSTPSSSTTTANVASITGSKEDAQSRPPNYPTIQLMNGPPSQQQPFVGYPPHGMQLLPGITYPGPEFIGPPPTSGGYPMPSSQFSQYPPPAWAYQQQQMQTGMSSGQKASQQMKPSQMGHQMTEDEQQQQQYHQQRLGSSSRLSSSSTPVSATDHQSRASSVVGNAQEKYESKDEEQRGGGVGNGVGQNQNQQRQAQTPSSSFSANAPTPPLTTSATPLPGPIGTTQSPSTAQISQQQMTSAATGYYHPAVPYSRYPPMSSGQSGEMYAAGPVPGIYGAPQQPPPMWGSPYGMSPQTRYHPPPPVAPTGRYPSYAVQSAIQQSQLQSAASNSHQQQSTTPGQQQTIKGTPMMSTPKAVGSSVYTPYGAAGPPSVRATGSANTGMLPVQAVPMPTYSSQSIPPQHFHAWFGSATMSTQPPPFPPQSLEAQTIAQIQQQQSTQIQQRFRRPKIYSRDLYGATPARIVMALRSSLYLETCWALNAINIQLYDDTTIPTMHQLSLAQTPELLNLIVEHFAAVLSLLYPRHFKTDTIDWGRLSTISPESMSSYLPDRPPKQEPIEHYIENNIKETIALMVRPPQSSSTTTNNNSEYLPKSMSNFTMISRLGRRVKLDQVEMPPELAAEVMEIWKGEKQLNEMENEKPKEEKKTFPKFMHRIRCQMIEQIQTRREIEKFEVFKKMYKEDFYKKDFLEEEENHIKEDHKPDIKEKGNIQENGPHLFHRQLMRPWERRDRHVMDESELVNRSTVLQNEHCDELMEQMVDRCLSLSNIIRGFSFLPGQERPLAQHTGLLRILSALLMLMVDEWNQRKTNDVGENGSKKFIFPKPSPANENESEEEIRHGDRQGQAMPSRQTIPPEHDSRKKWLLEVANQLRDDAFTILAHISPNLDLFDIDSTISWAIFDSLIHWSVSTDLQARDPLPPYGSISPRHYALEIICKMSVLERNVDLLISTGPWPRIEEFVRLLCSFVCEEPPVREFAIVILNAICGASESICNVVAIETDLLEYLITFLEAADANMTQIAQHQGIHILRENPEIIGTSVGMLRRAALILVQIVKQQNCRHYFHRFQHRLLQFTVSHYMDSRVAAMVADILFEMQQDMILKKGEISNGGDIFGDEQPIKQEPMDMIHKHNQVIEANNGHGKLSSSAVFQPPAKIEPELMFNGDENMEGMAMTENGGLSGDNVIDASFCSTTSSMIDPPSVENNSNQNKMTGRKSSKKRRSETSDSSESSSMLLENIGINHVGMDNNVDAHFNWNGHATTNHVGESAFENDNDIIQKKKSKKQMASPIGGTVGEIVREKMRNNILGKAAANQQKHKKKNGWIGSGTILNGIAFDNCVDGHNNEMELEEVEQSTSTTTTATKKQQSQMVGTTPTSPSSNSTTPITTVTPAQTLTVSTGANNANNNKNTAQSGSLTAVA